MSTADGPIRVLVVDDQELFRAGIEVVVDAQPDMAVVGHAGNGREAVQLVDEVAPDIVLMDLRMPEMDGGEATRRITARRDSAVPPVTVPRIVVMTTFELDREAAESIRGGASGFLLKGSTPELLCATIRAVHAGNEVMAPGKLRTLLDLIAVEPAPPPPAYGLLSEREREVFRAVGQGLSNAEIARSVFLSESTVKTHISSVLAKLGLRDRVQIVVFAHRYHLLQ